MVSLRHKRLTSGIGTNGRRAVGFLFAAIGSGTLVAGLVVLLGPVAAKATAADPDRAAAVNATRQILLLILGGLVAVVGLGFTARTFFLSRRGQLTGRYATAISQLASEKLTERLGGIYALEHLMRESPRDHQTVVEVLAAFIRERTQPPPHQTQADAGGTPTSSGLAPGERPRSPTDVQAALTVLGRRPVRAEPNPLYLAGADLRGADMTRLRFARANMDGTALQYAVMRMAELDGANLHEANLEHANLYRIRLRHADLRRAKLSSADMCEADLTATDFTAADLTGCDLTDAACRDTHFVATNLFDACLLRTQLHGAILAADPHQRPPRWTRREHRRPSERTTRNLPDPSQRLTREQLDQAYIDQTTLLPDELNGIRPGWPERIERP